MEKHSDAETQEVADLKRLLKKHQEEKERLEEKNKELREEKEQLKEKNLTLKEENLMLKEENLMLKEKNKELKEENLKLKEGKLPDQKKEELKVNIPKKKWLSEVNSELSALERPGAVTHLSIAFESVLTTTRSVSHRGFSRKSGRMQCKPSGIQW